MDALFAQSLSMAASQFEPKPPKFDLPGDLAKKLDPRTIQTPALDLIDAELARAFSEPGGRLIISMPPQQGKALALDTPVPTPTGWTTMGALKVGDRVIGGDGRPCCVTWVSPIWTGRDCYAVTTGDGERIVADGAHEWIARLDRRRSARVVDTVTLANPRSKNAQIAAPADGLELADADLPLDPYVFGVWLGDGNSSGPIITCHPDDVAIRDRFAEAGWPLKRQAEFRWSMTPAGWVNRGASYPSPAKTALRATGALGDKHIPTAYLRASRAQRLALLQGLIDSDGHVALKGQVEFCSMSRTLAEGVRELVYSLGGKAVMSEGRATIAGRDCGTKYRVRFYLADAAHLPRKRERCRDSSVGSVRYAKAERCDSVPTVCIEVDSPDHTFLAGRTMLPTHNSTRAAQIFPVWALQQDPDRPVIVASYGEQLAERNGETIRDHIKWNADALGISVRGGSSAKKRWKIDGHKGGVLSAGIGSGMTGWASGMTIIDDPIKDQAEADSQAYRDRVWNWWLSVAQTRLAPGAPVVAIMCMTGDTPVLLPGGSTKPLRDVRPGDDVATYEDGHLAVAKVMNWANQGPDDLFSVRMKSGRVVRANARHPFLTIDTNGAETWLRTDQIRPGQSILTATGGSGAESPVPSTDATSPRNARACAARTTTRPVGRPDIGPHLSTPSLAAVPDSSTDTGSRMKKWTSSLLSKVGAALSAASRRLTRTRGRTGTASSASTTTTTPARSAAYSATTATSPSDTASPQPLSAPQLSTWSVTPDEVVAVEPCGREDVYDLQIDRTENFIANGLVSHNTRWHEDDLAGRLLAAEDGHRWRVVNIPAQADHDPNKGETDPLGREPGEYMQTARRIRDAATGVERPLTETETISYWEQIKVGVGSRVWNALYQGRPAPTEGGILKRDFWREYTAPLWLERPDGTRVTTNPGDQLLISADFAFKDTAASDYVAIGVWMRRGPNAYLLDLIRNRLDFLASVRALRETAARWPQTALKLVEDKANGTAIIATLSRSIPGIVPEEPKGGKVERANAVLPFIEAGNVWLPSPEIAPWVGDFIEEAAAFPNGKHDDQVDMATQALRRLLLQPLLTDETIQPDEFEQLDQRGYLYSPY